MIQQHEVPGLGVAIVVAFFCILGLLHWVGILT